MAPRSRQAGKMRECSLRGRRKAVGRSGARANNMVDGVGGGVLRGEGPGVSGRIGGAVKGANTRPNSEAEGNAGRGRGLGSRGGEGESGDDHNRGGRECFMKWSRTAPGVQLGEVFNRARHETSNRVIRPCAARGRSLFTQPREPRDSSRGAKSTHNQKPCSK